MCSLCVVLVVESADPLVVTACVSSRGCQFSWISSSLCCWKGCGVGSEIVRGILLRERLHCQRQVRRHRKVQGGGSGGKLEVVLLLGAIASKRPLVRREFLHAGELCK